MLSFEVDTPRFFSPIDVNTFNLLCFLGTDEFDSLQ